MARQGAGACVIAAVGERTEANQRFFEAEDERIARLCHRVAERFARGGRLVAFGESAQARSDVRHVAVEFVHPEIVVTRVSDDPRTIAREGLVGLGFTPQEADAMLDSTEGETPEELIAGALRAGR